MKKAILSLIILSIVLSGCTFFQTITTVTLPNKKVYTVKSKSDSLVEWTDGKNKITVDLRGRPGMIEQALGIMFMNLPDVTVDK